MKEYSSFLVEKTVKKASRLKRGGTLVPSEDRQTPTELAGKTYRADDIGRQSRPLGQNQE